MWELDYKESWALKNWCFWTVVLEKTLESRLDCKEIQPVHPKGSQSWVFTGRTDVEAETLVLWPPDVKSWLIWKDPDAGKDWGQKEKGKPEDEMVGWLHWLNGHGSGGTPGVGNGQGGLVCYGSWGCKESDMTERLNWTELKIYSIILMILSHILLRKYFPTLLKFSKHISLKIAKQEMKERWWGSKMWLYFKPANINVTLEFFRGANSQALFRNSAMGLRELCFNKTSKWISCILVWEPLQ